MPENETGTGTSTETGTGTSVHHRHYHWANNGVSQPTPIPLEEQFENIFRNMDFALDDIHKKYNSQVIYYQANEKKTKITSISIYDTDSYNKFIFYFYQKHGKYPQNELHRINNVPGIFWEALMISGIKAGINKIWIYSIYYVKYLNCHLNGCAIDITWISINNKDIPLSENNPWKTDLNSYHYKKIKIFREAFIECDYAHYIRDPWYVYYSKNSKEPSYKNLDWVGDEYGTKKEKELYELAYGHHNHGHYNINTIKDGNELIIPDVDLDLIKVLMSKNENKRIKKYGLKFNVNKYKVCLFAYKGRQPKSNEKYYLTFNFKQKYYKKAIFNINKNIWRILIQASWNSNTYEITINKTSQKGVITVIKIWNLNNKKIHETKIEVVGEIKNNNFTKKLRDQAKGDNYILKVEFKTWEKIENRYIRLVFTKK